MAYLVFIEVLTFAGPVAAYAATVSHAFLYHRNEISKGFKSLISRTGGLAANKDIHSRLMMSYKEVPEWWYFTVLVISIGVGAAGVGAWPTSTTPAVVLYGVFLALILYVTWQPLHTHKGLQSSQLCADWYHLLDDQRLDHPQRVC